MRSSPPPIFQFVVGRQQCWQSLAVLVLGLVSARHPFFNSAVADGDGNAGHFVKIDQDDGNCFLSARAHPSDAARGINEGDDGFGNVQMNRQYILLWELKAETSARITLA